MPVAVTVRCTYPVPAVSSFAVQSRCAATGELIGAAWALLATSAQPDMPSASARIPCLTIRDASKKW